MTELDIFVISFGAAFFVASDRFKQLLSFIGDRLARQSNTRS
jgi:hypothetical protein